MEEEKEKNMKKIAIKGSLGGRNMAAVKVWRVVGVEKEFSGEER